MHGFHRFFSDNSKEERQHAEKFMKYQNERGGTIALQPIDVSRSVYAKIYYLLNKTSLSGIAIGCAGCVNWPSTLGGGKDCQTSCF